MIFVVGGSNQGKLNCAKEMFGTDHVFENHFHERVKKNLEEKWGKTPQADATNMSEIMEWAKQCLQEYKDNGSFDKLVIISDELGCGIVPIDAFEREYRELNGRVNCYFAKEANKVVRVVCGIGTMIKDTAE